MSPLYRVLPPNGIHRLAKSHAAVTECRLCFRRLKKDGENIRDFYGENP